MNSIAKVIIFFGFVMVLIPSLQQSSAYTVTYEILGKKINDTPLVCGIEPETNKFLPENFKESLMEETRIAVQEWESLLKQTENKKQKHIWNINYKMVSVEEQEDYDYGGCTVFISFEERPPDKEDWYRKIGITQNEVGDTERSNTIIYYAAIDFCMTQDKKFYYYDPCYADEPRLIQQLSSTIRHEFGHALGLGHYVSDDLGVNVQWARGGTPSPSIMAVFTHQNSQDNRIKTIDVKMVRELYGPGGFFSDYEFSEPTYIESLQATKSEFVIPEGGYEIATIWGFLNDTSNIVGIPVYINITRPDGTVEQRISRPSEDNKFQMQFIINKEIQEGTYLIAATYLNGKSQVTTFDVTSAENAILSMQTPNEIPLWIKNDVKKWVEGTISDRDFGLAIQNLNMKRFSVPSANDYDVDSVTPLKIPKWVKTTAGWWVEGHVPDEDFRNAMRFLVEKGIMII